MKPKSSHPMPGSDHPRTFERIAFPSFPEILGVLSLFLAINILSGIFQDPIRVHHGLGWDGWEYGAYAKQIARDLKPAGFPPKIWRIGTPYLAAWAGGEDVRTGFLIANLWANLLTVLLFAVWLSLWIKDGRIRWLLHLLFMTNWIGPVRHVWFYGALTDHWTLTLILGALIVIKIHGSTWRGALLLGLLSFAGAFIREILVAVPLAFLAVNLRWERFWGSLREGWWMKLFPLLAFLAGRVAVFHCVDLIETPEGGVGSFNTLDFLVESFKKNPLDRWPLGWFIAFGPILAVLVMGPGRALSVLWKDPPILAFSFLIILATIIGGWDFERYFIMWLAPVVYMLIGVTLEAGLPILRYPLGIALGLLLQGVSQRVFWLIPEQYNNVAHLSVPHVLLTPLGEPLAYFDLMSVPVPASLAHLRLGQYLLVVLAFWLIDRFASRRKGGRPEIRS